METLLKHYGNFAKTSLTRLIAISHVLQAFSDRQTNQPTDGQTNRPTDWLIELRARD